MSSFSSLTVLLLLNLLAGSLPGVAEAARPQVIKIGTMAPRGTLPHRALLQMAELFDEATDGQIQVKIYPGVVGDEPTIVRKLRVGQLQGALLSAAGLGNISKAPIAIQLPMMFTDEAEIDAVLAEMTPTFDRALAEHGLVSLAWSDAGWIYLFSDKPAAAIEDVRDRKMWLWQHDDGAVACFAELGVEPVVLSEIDMVPALRTGMVDTVPATTMAALALQLYPSAPHMIEVPIAFMMAAVVIRQDSWERIDPELRKKIREKGRSIGLEMTAQARRDNKTALDELKKRGVIVHRPTAAQRKVWAERGAIGLGKARGVSAPAELVDEVLRRRDAFRARQKK